jgi:metal-dependent amidase/aminoacylase/carboxypeptidase family protein
VNDNSLTLRVLDHAREYLGEDHVEILDQRMTSEDFAFYTQRIPGCFYRLGIKNKEKGIVSNLHTATFNVDERSLETGMGLMAWITLRELMR